ncbi:hypothetical protein Tco_0073774 [Tanacetum coccineum]
MANPDDEPMWAADRLVAPTPGLTITIPATANEFAIKEFSQHERETLTDAWLRMKELLKICHGSYDPPTDPKDSQNQKDSHTPIDFNSDDEDEEPTPQPQTRKPNKEAVGIW